MFKMGNCINRRLTKKIKIGNMHIGGGGPVLIQSMTNTDTRDVRATVEQIRKLEEAGCDIVRVAVPDSAAAGALKQIKKEISIPLVADIHFDYRLALKSMENGADKVRINPGNIGGWGKVGAVAKMASELKVPIRIGVNSGSLEKRLLEKYGGVTPEAMVESALEQAKALEDNGFNLIVFSLKASSVPLTIAAYRMLSGETEYPLHVGITEAGTLFRGTIKSSVGIGCLLAEGIGDTVRVSLTGDPVEEVKVGKEILRSLELTKGGVELISCPTCGRCGINLVDLANRLDNLLREVDKDIKVAVMGCAVNGPGEAREADIGIAGGKGEALIFKKGRIIKKVTQERIIDELLKEIESL